MRKFVAIIIVILLVCLVVDVLEPAYGYFGKVPTASVGVVTRFGEVSGEVLSPGFHVKGWFSKINSISTRTQSYSLSTAAFSSDIQQVDVTIRVSYNVDEQSAPTLFVTVGKDYESILLQPRMTENTKIVMARYSAEALVENRGTLSEEILVLMQTDLAPYGINVTSVSIEDIDFTDAFTTAVENKQVATQEKLTAETEQERLTMEAEAEQERRLLEANTDAEIKRIATDTEAYDIATRATAEAEANKKIAESLTAELIDYIQAQNWDGALPASYVGTGDLLPVLNLSGD